jgi:TonB family protein
MVGPALAAMLLVVALPGTPPQASQQPPAPATRSAAWPPEGVLRLKSVAGLEAPRVIKDVKPKYSPGAMDAKTQGNVKMEAVVLADGTVGEVRVTHSLDRELDEAAVQAMKRWRFAPGKKDGVAVPVLVEVEMTFSLR